MTTTLVASRARVFVIPQDSVDPGDEPNSSTILYLFPIEGGVSQWLHEAPTSGSR